MATVYFFQDHDHKFAQQTLNNAITCINSIQNIFKPKL